MGDMSQTSPSTPRSPREQATACLPQQLKRRLSLSCDEYTSHNEHALSRSSTPKPFDRPTPPSSLTFDHNEHPSIFLEILHRTPPLHLLKISESSRKLRQQVSNMLCNLKISYSLERWTHYNGKGKVSLKEAGVLLITASKGYVVALCSHNQHLINYQRRFHPRLPFYDLYDTVTLLTRISLLQKEGMILDLVGLVPQVYHDPVLAPIFQNVPRIKAVRYLPDPNGQLTKFVPFQVNWVYLLENWRAAADDWSFTHAGLVYVIHGGGAAPQLNIYAPLSHIIIDFRPWDAKRWTCRSGTDRRLADFVDYVGFTLKKGRQVSVVGMEKMDSRWLYREIDLRAEPIQERFLRTVREQRRLTSDECTKLRFFAANDPRIADIADFSRNAGQDTDSSPPEENQEDDEMEGEKGATAWEAEHSQE